MSISSKGGHGSALAAMPLDAQFQFDCMVDTEGLRTLDLLTASQAFYQLNYWPITFPDVFSFILSQDQFQVNYHLQI